MYIFRFNYPIDIHCSGVGMDMIGDDIIAFREIVRTCVPDDCEVVHGIGLR